MLVTFEVLSVGFVIKMHGNGENKEAVTVNSHPRQREGEMQKVCWKKTTMYVTKSSEDYFIFNPTLYITRILVLCCWFDVWSQHSGYCSLQHSERERSHAYQTCESCVVHCFDLPCRLQDLKHRASNRMLQMVKVLPPESNMLLRRDMLLLDLCVMQNWNRFGCRLCVSPSETRKVIGNSLK